MIKFGTLESLSDALLQRLGGAAVPNVISTSRKLSVVIIASYKESGVRELKYWVHQSLIAAALLAATSLAAAAQDDPNDEVAPYDSGYASKAALRCPGLAMTFQTSIATEAARDFTSGTAMFDMLTRKQSLEAACKSALNLYDSKTGKIAKILIQK